MSCIRDTTYDTVIRPSHDQDQLALNGRLHRRPFNAGWSRLSVAGKERGEKNKKMRKKKIEVSEHNLHLFIGVI